MSRNDSGEGKKECWFVFNSRPHPGFFFFIVYFLCFSYNWPAQTDGVDYGDADEVNNLSYCE